MSDLPSALLTRFMLIMTHTRRILTLGCSHQRAVLQAILLILPAALLLGGCSYLTSLEHVECKTRAYVRIPIDDFLNSRVSQNPLMRMAVLPMVVEANLAGYSDQTPSMGARISWKLHGELLKQDKIPIVESVNWYDWPLKREDFFSGNFQALRKARESGFDLVFAGLIESSKPDELTALGKLIDVHEGVTIWYGRIYAFSLKQKLPDTSSPLFFSRDHSLSDLSNVALQDELASCMAEQALNNEPPDDSNDFSFLSFFSSLSI